MTVNMKKINCPYVDQCRDYPELCRECANNKKPSFFKISGERRWIKEVVENGVLHS